MNFTSLEEILIILILLYTSFLVYLFIRVIKAELSHDKLSKLHTQLVIDITHMIISDENIPNANCKLGCEGKGKVNIGEGILERPCLCTLRLDFDDRK